MTTLENQDFGIHDLFFFQIFQLLLLIKRKTRRAEKQTEKQADKKDIIIIWKKPSSISNR
jgi:hypothetical protein